MLQWRNQACVDFCQKHGMVITAYSPLGSPDSLSSVNRHEDVRPVAARTALCLLLLQLS